MSIPGGTLLHLKPVYINKSVRNVFRHIFSQVTWRYCDVESTSLTLIQRRNNVVWPVSVNIHLKPLPADFIQFY